MLRRSICKGARACMCTDESLSIFFNDNIDDIQGGRGVEGLCQSGKTTVISCRAREKKEESMRFSCVLLSMLALMDMTRRGGKSAEKSRAKREKRGVGKMNVQWGKRTRNNDTEMVQREAHYSSSSARRRRSSTSDIYTNFGTNRFLLSARPVGFSHWARCQ